MSESEGRGLFEPVAVAADSGYGLSEIWSERPSSSMALFPNVDWRPQVYGLPGPCAPCVEDRGEIVLSSNIS